MWVPARPAAAASRSGSAAMTASPAVRSTKRQAASTFGAIDPGANDSWRSSAGVAVTIGVAAGVPPVALDVRDIGEDDQPVGIELFGEQCGCEVLVDDRVDSVQTVAVGNDGDAAPAGADDDAPGGEEPLDRVQLDDRLRLRRGDDTSEVAPVACDRPAAAFGELPCFTLGVDGADRFRRAQEGGIVGIDAHLRQQRRRRRAAPELICGALGPGDSRSCPCALSAEHVERVRRHVLVGLCLECEEPDLGPVAVRDDELVVERPARRGRGRPRGRVPSGLPPPPARRGAAARSRRERRRFSSSPLPAREAGCEREQERLLGRQPVRRLLPDDATAARR